MALIPIGSDHVSAVTQRGIENAALAPVFAIGNRVIARLICRRAAIIGPLIQSQETVYSITVKLLENINLIMNDQVIRDILNDRVCRVLLDYINRRLGTMGQKKTTHHFGVGREPRKGICRGVKPHITLTRSNPVDKTVLIRQRELTGRVVKDHAVIFFQGVHGHQFGHVLIGPHKINIKLATLFGQLLKHFIRRRDNIVSERLGHRNDQDFLICGLRRKYKTGCQRQSTRL